MVVANSSRPKGSGDGIFVVDPLASKGVMAFVQWPCDTTQTLSLEILMSSIAPFAITTDVTDTDSRTSRSINDYYKFHIYI